MSDAHRIKDYYKRICKLERRVIRLRWEGAGDCRHPARILARLVDWGVPFATEVCVYEGKTHNNAKRGLINLREVLTRWAKIAERAKKAGRSMQRCSIKLSYNVSVTRPASKVGEGGEMDFIFVRNIMPTGNRKKVSETNNSSGLTQIHQGAVRNRRNSLRLNEKSTLNIGVSGAPGLVSASANERSTMNSEDLFTDYQTLEHEASDTGYWGWTVDGDQPDFDEGDVMKNDGKNIGTYKKKTYYQRFYK